MKNFENVIESLQKKISFYGLFFNANAGFDAKGFRNFVSKYNSIDNKDNNKRSDKNYDSFFDYQLYKKRFVI